MRTQQQAGTPPGAWLEKEDGPAASSLSQELGFRWGQGITCRTRALRRPVHAGAQQCHSALQQCGCLTSQLQAKFLSKWQTEMTQCTVPSDSAWWPPFPGRMALGGAPGSVLSGDGPSPSHEGLHLTCFHGASCCTGLSSSAFTWHRDQHMQNPGGSVARLRNRQEAVW